MDRWTVTLEADEATAIAVEEVDASRGIPSSTMHKVRACHELHR